MCVENWQMANSSKHVLDIILLLYCDYDLMASTFSWYCSFIGNLMSVSWIYGRRSSVYGMEIMLGANVSFVIVL